MTRERVTDEVVTLPSADSDGHTHPLPKPVRVILGVFAVALAVFGLLVLLLLAQVQRQQVMLEEQQERTTAAVLDELDRRTAARNLSDAEQQAEIEATQERVRLAVCAILPDLGRGAGVRQLAREFRCGPLPAPAPEDAPAATAERPAEPTTAPAAVAQPRRTPTSSPRQTPAARPTTSAPARTPTPAPEEPTCLPIPLLRVCL